MTFSVACLLIAVGYFFIMRSRLVRIIIATTGVVGVPVHELGHLLFVYLFGCKPTHIKLFQLPSASSNTLGYVSYQYSATLLAPIKVAFISIAPIFFGVACLSVLTPLLPVIDIHALSLDFLLNYGINFVKTATLLQWGVLYLCTSITIYMLPSSTDIKGALKGTVMVVASIYFIMVLGGISLSFIFEPITHYLNQIGVVMLFGVILTLPIYTVAALTRR